MVGFIDDLQRLVLPEDDQTYIVSGKLLTSPVESKCNSNCQEHGSFMCNADTNILKFTVGFKILKVQNEACKYLALNVFAWVATFA